MTVLVTGATGYIGRRVALRLLRQGRAARVLCRDAGWLDRDLRSSPLVDVFVGDVSDEEAMRRACADVSGIVHLAAGTGGSAEDFDRATIQGTRTLLKAATDAGVSRVVYISSMSVYDYSGLADGSLVDEDAPLESHPEQRDNYARSKRIAEDVVAEHIRRGAIAISVVRPGIVYGPNNRSPLVPVTSLRSLKRKAYLLVGGGRRQVPLVYVENLVDALLLLLDCESCAGHVYNVIDTDPPTERTYLDIVQRVTGSPLPIVAVPTTAFLPLAYALQTLKRLRGCGGMDVVHGLRRVTKHVRFDAGKLQRELGWTSRVGLEQGMVESFGPPSVPANPVSQAVRPRTI